MPENWIPLIYYRRANTGAHPRGQRGGCSGSLAGLISWLPKIVGSPSPLTASAARRHKAVETDVDNQVAVVIHVVLDRPEDSRPALDLLAPHLDPLQRLFLAEPGPDCGAVVVALP